MSEHGGFREKVVCFSGRFDRPHIGHVISIMRLGQRFRKVIVPVLDYPEQSFSVQYRVQILRECLNMATGVYEVFANRTHYAKISLDEAKAMCFDVYASSNEECLKHVESLGFPVLYVDRSFDYSASEEKISRKVKELFTL